MKLLYVFLIIAITTFNDCEADLPPYCGADSGDYPKSSEGTLIQVHLVTRYQVMLDALFHKCLSIRQVFQLLRILLEKHDA